MRFFLAGVIFAVSAIAEPNAVRLSKYILTVSDLDKTYAFYHDALGIQLDGNVTELRKPQPGSPANQITGSPTDSSFRNANTRIPGADFTFEFIELTGQPRTARRPRLQDPGASILVFTVRDVDAALAAVKKAGAKVITPGGMPLPNEKQGRSVLISDPDGFFVLLAQPVSLPATTAPPDSLVIGARWGTVVQDANKSANFYHDHFGFEVITTESDKNSPDIKIAGTAGARILQKRIQIPGSNGSWAFYEFKDIERQAVHFNVPDPGSIQLGFQVRDVDAAAEAYKSAGGTIVSKDGAIIRRPNGAVALMRDPDGVYLEVATPPKQ